MFDQIIILDWQLLSYGQGKSVFLKYSPCKLFIWETDEKLTFHKSVKGKAIKLTVRNNHCK